MNSTGDWLMTEHEAAQFLGVSVRTLKRLRARRQIPFYPIRANGSRCIIRYRKSDLERFLAKIRVSPTRTQQEVNIR